MTTAPQLAVGTTLQGIDDVSFSAFQQLNAPFGAQLITGNIFLGIQGYFAVAVPIGEQLGLARGATIETGLTNAAVTLRSAGAWSAGGAISIDVLVDDGPRGGADDGLGESGDLDPRLAWKPPGGFGPAWRRDFWGQFDHRLEDTGGSPFLDTGLGGSGTFGLRAVAGHRDELAQPFTVPAGPAWSVARTILELQKVGAPTGSVEVAIQASQSNGVGGIEPDGVDVAVSAAVTCASIPAGPGPITFAFAPDAVLSPGTYWTILRSAVPYPVSITDFLIWMQQRAFLGTGGAHRTLTGVRFDQGNYPGHVDVHLDTLAKELGPPIAWSPPASAGPGATFTTPNLSPLVQEVARRAGHETRHALCFTFRTTGETRTFRFASHDHATLAEPGFACQFRRRDHRGGVR